jgi:hypothetical protein
MTMLGWEKGSTWKVRLRSMVPSTAAVLDPPDEVHEDELTYEVLKEEDGLWVVSVKGLGRYELRFSKEPMALQGVQYFYTTRPGNETMWDEVASNHFPASYIHGHLATPIPFIIDFPLLLEPIPSGLNADIVIEDKDHGLQTEFTFEGGRPFWTHARRTWNGQLRKEGWLL